MGKLLRRPSSICHDMWKLEKRNCNHQKHKQNTSYQEARKITEAQYPKLSYASATKENLEKEQAKKKTLEMLIQKILTIGLDDWPKFVKNLRPTLLPKTTQPTNYPLETKSQELTKTNTPLVMLTQSNQRRNRNTPTKTNALTEEHSQTTTTEEKSIRKTTQEIPNSNKITKEMPKENLKKQNKANLKNKPKDREKTLTKTEDIKSKSSSKQRPIIKVENKFETLEYMEMDDELDTESAINSNQKNSQKTRSETVSTKVQNPFTSKNNSNEHQHQTN